MSVRVRVPLFDPNITEGVLTDWRISVGQTVRPGDILVDLVTDKANFEIESPAGGTLLAVTAAEKSTVPVGSVIAVIGEEGETVPDVTEENRQLLAEHLKKAAVVQTPQVPVKPSSESEPVQRVRATPKARKLAKRLGIDLTKVAQITQGSRVSEKDVQDYANASGSE